MKASEAIKRIQELMELSGGDPDVLVEGCGLNSLELAAIELQACCRETEALWLIKDKGNTEHAIKVF